MVSWECPIKPQEASGLDPEAVHINRKNLEIRPWPADTTYPFDVDRRAKLLQKARAIRDGIREAGAITSKADVPFEDCGCWLCGQE
ncbi:hypothetical protein [Halorientalis regularis]|uniref:Uncharacterized protein n=1 Tax=Halorientalis regularis TaxID=660518 RepID=A0A1G7RTB6_9EURY|nr:hypothetical protein [Halorientalis regularis]SDG14107.1 hypothetical protein SAMN05216218_11627 [Halorientalis regularis]